MKNRANWLLIPTVALGLGACKKEEAAKAPEAPAAVAEKAAPNDVPVPAAEKPKAAAVSVEERAAKVGFAKYLPQDTEMVLAFYNGSKTAERVKASKVWKLVQEQMGAGGLGLEGMEEMDVEEEVEEAPEQGAEPEEQQAVEPEDAEAPVAGEAPDADAPPESTGPAILFGSEFTFALGKSTGDQLGLGLNLNRRMTYYQMRDLSKALVASMKSGDFSTATMALLDASNSSLKQAMKDPAVNPALFEKGNFPPVYAAFKVAEADRPGAALQVANMLESINTMAADSGFIEPVKVEKAGTSFDGVKVVGAKASAKIAEGREDLDEELGAETTDQLLAALAKKDLIVVTGTLGDYVVVYLGPPDGFALEETPAKSLVGGEALAFTDSYLSKELAALVYGQKDMLQKVMDNAGGLSDITNGFRDGLAGAEGLGDTRDLEKLLQLVGEREAALRKLAGLDSTGIIAYFEEGLKIEGYGGADNGMVDWKATNKLATLGDSNDVLLFANVTTDAGYDEKAHAYLESLVETAYAMTVKISEMPMENEEMAQFKGSVELFDTKFRPDVLALWDAFGNEFTGSLGNESALVIDMKGAAPAIPGLAQEVVDKLKIPRVSVIRPVEDRTKLSGSWDKMNSSLTSVLGKVSEMTGAEIPMQKPMSSEKNGNTTWFFPFPMFTDDFLPSVTVGDKWFVASTSKIQALDLIGQADASTITRDGAWFSMNFRTLEKYADETFKLYSENAESITGAAIDPEDEKKIKDAISILGDLDKLTAHSRREGSVIRSSVHFKTR